jgi:uncharacterized protein (TIGR03437 family)
LQGDISGLPAGFTWTASAATADLAGTFNAPGEYKFTVSATCADGFSRATYTVKVGGPLTMLSGPFLPPCNVGVGCLVNLTKDGAPAYTARVSTGALPAGCELDAGKIGDSNRGVRLACMASTAGTYNFQIAVTDGLQESLSQSYSLVVGPPGPFYTSRNVMTFALLAGSPAQSQPVAVGTSELSVVNFTVKSDAPWLAANPASGKTPASIEVAANPTSLTKGSHVGHLTFTPDGGKQPVTMTVTAVVGEPAALLGAAPDLVEIDIPPADTVRNYLMSFHAWNSGSLALTAQVSAISSSAVRAWLTVQPAEVSLAPGEMKVLSVRADATRLPAGTHQGWVQVRTGTQSRMVPVTVVVPKVTKVPILSVSKSAWSSGPIYYHLTDTNFDDNLVNVMNDEWSTVMDFTASVEGFQGYAGVHPAEGRSTAGKPAQVSISINQAKLGPGRYEGLMTVTAPGAKNSPSYSKLLHTLTSEGAESGSATPIEVESTTPALLASAGATAQIKLVNPSNAPVNFTVVCPGGELTVDTPSGVVEARGSTTVTAKVDGSKLSNQEKVALWEARMWGLYNSYTSRQVETLLIPSRSQPGAGPSMLAAGACSASKLYVAPAAPATHFNRLADWPVEIRAAVVDDCGNPVTGAGVTAAFSSGDASVALKLADENQGIYRGVWTPGVAGGVTITVRATKDAWTASRQIYGSIAEDAASPVIYNGGIVNNVFPVLNAPASPGAIVAIYGKNLSSTTAQAQAVPLPRQLGGTTVLIGGIEAPLFFVSPGQINAQVPMELASDEVVNVVIKTGQRVTTPKTLRLAKLSPGIVAFADGRAIAQHPDYSLVSASAPVKPGGYFILYLIGMGPVDQPVASGAASPSSPLAMVTAAPVVTMGGTRAEVVFAGMTPGGVGLYQLVVKVPDSVSPGDLPLVLTQEGVAANTVTLPVAR